MHGYGPEEQDAPPTPSARPCALGFGQRQGREEGASQALGAGEGLHELPQPLALSSVVGRAACGALAIPAGVDSCRQAPSSGTTTTTQNACLTRLGAPKGALNMRGGGRGALPRNEPRATCLSCPSTWDLWRVGTDCWPSRRQYHTAPNPPGASGEYQALACVSFLCHQLCACVCFFSMVLLWLPWC